MRKGLSIIKRLGVVAFYSTCIYTCFVVSAFKKGVHYEQE